MPPALQYELRTLLLTAQEAVKNGVRPKTVKAEDAHWLIWSDLIPSYLPFSILSPSCKALLSSIEKEQLPPVKMVSQLIMYRPFSTWWHRTTGSWGPQTPKPRDSTAKLTIRSPKCCAVGEHLMLEFWIDWTILKKR